MEANALESYLTLLIGTNLLLTSKVNSTLALGSNWCSYIIIVLALFMERTIVVFLKGEIL